MACEISWCHTLQMHFTTATVLYFELNTVFQTESTSCASSDTGWAVTGFSRTSVSRVQHPSREANIFSCCLCRAGTLQAHRVWKSQVQPYVPEKQELIHLETTAIGNISIYRTVLPTLVINFPLRLLQFSFAAALDWTTLVITRGGSGELSSVSDVHGSCVLGQQSKSSWPQLVEISKGSGYFSSGLDPSSLFLALQSISDLEMERNFLDLLFPASLFRSIFRELVVLLFFLSFSHLCGMILSITFSASLVLNILQERKHKK